MSHKEDVFGKAYERGTVVFRQGEVGHSMYIIQSGAVEVSQIQGHHEVVIAVLEKGDFFGEMALIDPERRSCTVTAIGHTRLLSMN
jgi:CRP/FNR family cyclic AMP-dependent transcriptional regulator